MVPAPEPRSHKEHESHTGTIIFDCAQTSIHDPDAAVGGALADKLPLNSFHNCVDGQAQDKPPRERRSVIAVTGLKFPAKKYKGKKVVGRCQNLTLYFYSFSIFFSQKRIKNSSQLNNKEKV
jgi:hypothetical protein